MLSGARTSNRVGTPFLQSTGPRSYFRPVRPQAFPTRRNAGRPGESPRKLPSFARPGGDAPLDWRKRMQTPPQPTLTPSAAGEALRIRRVFTEPGVHPFDTVEWELRTAAV